MINKIKELMVKYRELIVYLIVGVLNTIVSWAGCWVAGLFLDSAISIQNSIINIIGWIVGVVFGYFANRIWVFRSTNPNIWKEFIQFAGARVSTGIMDIVIMYVTVNLLHMDYWISKIFISSVLVMISNYILSKLFIFKKKSE